ncbi:alpha/beta hydrolase [Paracoccus sp. PXZ]|uniref:alpha/beta fold hydrolase n=1 Tax=Pseudochrobactrum sp. B5 TaxID=1289478 RepID=UPI0009F9BD15|nr:alpha/beta hydrolase [Pseudochrobactrum sp. B5]
MSLLFSGRRSVDRSDAAAWCPSRRELLRGGAVLGLSAGLAHVLTGTAAVAADSFPLRQAMMQINGQMFRIIEQGTGGAVLFCHGFPDTAATWRSQMRAVAEAGYRAIALDMRGYGDSYAPAEADLYTSLHIVGDLVGVLDVLEIPSAVVVGHDWGADHAQRAALLRPDRFRALVSLSIPYAPRGDVNYWDFLRSNGFGKRYYALDMLHAGAEQQFEPAARSIPSILYWLSASPEAGTGWDPVDPPRNMLRPSPVTVPDWADPSYVSHTIRAFDKTGFGGGLNYYRALPKTFDLTPAFKNAGILQPSLYIWGEADGLCQFFHPGAPSVDDLRKAQPGLVGAIKIEKAGHWLQHEAADRVNAELLRFLRSI